MGRMVEKVGKSASFSSTVSLGLTLPISNQSSDNNLGALKIALGLDDVLAGHTNYDIPPPECNAYSNGGDANILLVCCGS